MQLARCNFPQHRGGLSSWNRSATRHCRRSEWPCHAGVLHRSFLCVSLARVSLVSCVHICSSYKDLVICPRDDSKQCGRENHRITTLCAYFSSLWGDEVLSRFKVLGSFSWSTTKLWALQHHQFVAPSQYYLNQVERNPLVISKESYYPARLGFGVCILQYYESQVWTLHEPHCADAARLLFR